jgi:hypothetical protein
LFDIDEEAVLVLGHSGETNAQKSWNSARRRWLLMARRL